MSHHNTSKKAVYRIACWGLAEQKIKNSCYLLGRKRAGW